MDRTKKRMSRKTKNMIRKLKFNLYSKYCRRFCRTGFCVKGNNCSFTHEKSKVAICQKFIYGICKSKKCLLSHEPTPDRMPDCIFFLRGFCNANGCRFRHVKVNKDATLCKGFLKGFCLKGLKCELSHQFECRSFKRTGKCPKGNKCNFAHSNQDTSVKQSLAGKANNNNNSEDNSKFKIINIRKQPNVKNDKNENKETNEVEKKNMLSKMLEKRLKSLNHKIMMIGSGINEKQNDQSKEFEQNPSFIKLSSIDGATDSDLKPLGFSSANNGSVQLDQLNQSKSINHQQPSTTMVKKKYFIIDEDDDEFTELFNLNIQHPQYNEHHEICRPQLKIIPDFLMPQHNEKP